MSGPMRRASRSPTPKWRLSKSAATRSILNGTTRSTHVRKNCSNCFCGSPYVEVLDLARFNGPQHRDILRNYLREKYHDKRIGVIVTLGSVAFKALLPMREELWSGIP